MSPRPDWNLFSTGTKTSSLRGRRAAADAENLAEAERILADPVAFGGDGAALVTWARLVVNRLSGTQAPGGEKKPNPVNPRTVGFPSAHFPQMKNPR